MLFYQLCQLQRVRCSLDADSSATLIQAFVTSCIDYCNGLFAGAPNVWTDKLQWVLNAAARVLTEMNKYDPRLTQILHSDVHWLDVPERIKYKLSHGFQVPSWNGITISPKTVHPSRTDRGTMLAALCCLRSTRHFTNNTLNLRKQAFAGARPSAWNSLPDWFKDTSLSLCTFKTSLKTFLFSEYGKPKHYRDNLWYTAITNKHLHLLVNSQFHCY